MNQSWKAGIFGVVVGDALGCPVQFERREKVASHPVTGMRGQGTFNLPAGSWTDDSSLTLALLESICSMGTVDLDHIMGNFMAWLEDGEFTPFDYSFDIGLGTERAIERYEGKRDPATCGGREESNNGNGSLMRILPVCLYCCAKGLEDAEALAQVDAVGSLTHAHLRSRIACGLYFFMVRSVLSGTGSLVERLQAGLDRGFAYYEETLDESGELAELEYYNRLRDLSAFALVPADKISSGGYVVETLEAAVWSLVTTGSFKEALLKAVNLGEDTDTVGAIAGGLGALYYGYEGIPTEWIAVLQKKEWIAELCDRANETIGMKR